MKAKIMMVVICFWFVVNTGFVLMILVGIAKNGSITFNEPNNAILYTEIGYTFLLIVLGFAGFIHEVRK